MEVIRLPPLTPQDMAKRLIKKYEYEKEYCIPKGEFKRISGKKNLRDAYIDKIDVELRKKEFLLINLISEQDIIAIANIDTILNWPFVD